MQKKIALSGASGNVGRMLRKALIDRGIDLRSAGHSKPLEPIVDGEDIMHGDLRDEAVVDKLLAGVEVLIHLAGTSIERPLDEIIENNLVALHAVYEGARRNRVKRVIFASSNHAFGLYSVDEKLSLDAPYRPDGLYGLSKAWGELMAKMYWDKHGIESVCLRIGSCEPAPQNFRHLSTWLGHEDTVDLVIKSINAENIGFLPVWGISNNTRSYWQPNESADIGYQPQQNAEAYASEILAKPSTFDAVAKAYQGGLFVSADFTPLDERPGSIP